MRAAARTPQEPLKHVDEWDDFVATRYREGRGESDFRNFERETNSPHRGVLSPKSHPANRGLRSLERAGVWSARARQARHLGSGGLPEYAGR